MAAKKAYFGLSRVVSIILAIIPITACICGIIQTILEGKIVNGIFRILFGWNIVWILDIIWIVMFGRLCHILFLW